MADNEKTNMVVRYLTGLTAHASTFEPEPIPSEMELCKKFSVSRVTVRRAIARQLLGESLIRLPGKKRIYTNPLMAKHMPMTIGIGFSSGYTYSQDESTGAILSNFLAKMGEDPKRSLLYYFINDGPEKDLESIVKDQQLDGLFFLEMGREGTLSAEELIRKKFPVIVLASPYYAESCSTLKENVIARDFALFGKKLGEFILKNNWKRCAYIGTKDRSLEAFKKCLSSRNIPFPEELYTEETSRIAQWLSSLLEAGKIDCIYANGGSERYLPILRVLNEISPEKRVPVIWEKFSVTLQYQQEFPHLSILLPEELAICNFMGRSGKKAAELLLKLLKEPGKKTIKKIEI